MVVIFCVAADVSLTETRAAVVAALAGLESDEDDVIDQCQCEQSCRLGVDKDVKRVSACIVSRHR